MNTKFSYFNEEYAKWLKEQKEVWKFNNKKGITILSEVSKWN